MGAIDIIGSYSTKEVVVWVEDPSGNAPVFFKKGVNGKRQALKVAQSVGGVKRESKLLIQGLQKKGYEVRAIVPGKRSQTKLTAEAFNDITKYSGRTNEHSRDAAMLVFQRVN